MFLSNLRTTSALSASLALFTILAENAVVQDVPSDADVITVTETHRTYHSSVISIEASETKQVIGAVILDQVGVQNLNQAVDLSSSIARSNNFGGLWNMGSFR